MNDAVHTTLWEWLADADDPDPEQRAWKVAFAGGMLEAARAAGLLSGAEADAYAAVLAGSPVPAPVADADVAAAERHLAALRDRIGVLRRDATDADRAASLRHDGALAALEAAGVLAGAHARRLRAEALARQAPWMDRDELDELAGHDGGYALHVPPASAEEEREDAEAEAAAERLGHHSPAERVLVSTDLRRADGLVVLAAVLRADVVDLVFHHVADAGEGEPPGHLDAFERTLARLTPPTLRGDDGTVYAPLADRPVHASGSSRRQDGAWCHITAGAWRYGPAAPAGTARLVAGDGDAGWTLG